MYWANKLSALLLAIVVNNSQAQNNSSRIIIEGRVPPGFNKTSVSFQVYPTDALSYLDIEGSQSEIKIDNGTVKWEGKSEGPTMVFTPLLNNQSFFALLAEPGDSISIRYQSNKPVFSGKGANAATLLYLLKQTEDSLDQLPLRQKISRKNMAVSSLEDYLGWHEFLQIKTAAMLPLVEKFRSRISDSQYEYIKYTVTKDIEKRRLWKFNTIRINSTDAEKNQFDLTNEDLCKLFDSTMQSPQIASLFRVSEMDTDLFYHWSILKLMLYRERNRFFKTTKKDPPILGKDKEDPYILQYDLAKKKFKGLFREKLMAFAFWDQDGLFKEVGFTNKVDSLLKDYYHQPGYSEYKSMVKRFEVLTREKYNKTIAASFTLTDRNGNLFTNQQLKGKVSVLEFWFTGCSGCGQMKAALENVEAQFRSDSSIVFVKISTDKDFKTWQSSLKQGKYVSGNGIHLYTSGKGAGHDIISNYDISGYPSLFLIDQAGGIIPYDHFNNDPRRDGGKALINLLKKELAVSMDGPYVFYQNQDSVMALSIQANAEIMKEVSSPERFKIVSRTDNNTPFTFPLKKKLENELSVFNRPEELLLFSDIEGNFLPLKELLINNGVIDEELNWTFGKGHLVFAGDMFDRGRQVTECLWLLYSLEEKAKLAGGYVHFILGNHELMNLQGDHRYAIEKYHTNARLLGFTLKELYSSDSELGRWLRTKNIMEKIGNLLVTHGGISAAINKMPFTLSEINAISRPFFDQPAKSIRDSTVRMLMHNFYGPFWYRGYYSGKSLAPQSQIDSTLQKFGVDHIITGHTVIADTISTHYNNKVINTDTRHANGESEALYIKGKKYFRVNKEGARVFLFDDPAN